MSTYTPLHSPDDAPPFQAPLAVEISATRSYLAEVATTNIHDEAAILRAAVGLDYRLRALLAALDTKRGEGS